MYGNMNQDTGAGKATAIVDAVKEAEKTETGQYALTLAKGTITAVLVLVGIGIFFSIRSMNRMFGESKKQISAAKEVSLKARLKDYISAKNPEWSDAQTENYVNSIL